MSTDTSVNTKSKPFRFLEFTFRKSAQIVESGFYLIGSALIVGLFWLFLTLVSNVDGEITGILSLFEMPFVVGGAVVIVSLFFHLTNTFQKISRADPHGEAHASDFLFGILLLHAGYYGISIGHFEIRELEADMISMDFLLGSFVFTIIAGWYAIVAGVFINGLSRVLIHVFGWRRLIRSTYQDLRWTFQSLLPSKWVRVYRLLTIYRQRRGISRIAAFTEVFFSGLAMIEPVDAEDHDQIRNQIETADDKNPIYHLSSGSERWYSVFVYSTAATIVLVFYGWIFLTKGGEDLYEVFRFLTLLISVFIGFSILPGWLKDISYLREQHSGYQSYWWEFGVLSVPIIFLFLVIQIIWYEPFKAAEYTLLFIQLILLTGFLQHLFRRRRYL
ncbi:hypothetical protein [Natrinema sp. DC36]|uniref:hypothetical protein n=1 Tax=Natrinema sp. DC36 TaxID=2878680 RepID=UPI001CF07582|nr:hypothetical protein [Natrinema sp. DC36]